MQAEAQAWQMPAFQIVSPSRTALRSLPPGQLESVELGWAKAAVGCLRREQVEWGSREPRADSRRALAPGLLPAEPWKQVRDPA
jgi:hypothetical protein